MASCRTPSCQSSMPQSLRSLRRSGYFAKSTSKASAIVPAPDPSFASSPSRSEVGERLQGVFSMVFFPLINNPWINVNGERFDLSDVQSTNGELCETISFDDSMGSVYLGFQFFMPMNRGKQTMARSSRSSSVRPRSSTPLQPPH